MSQFFFIYQKIVFIMFNLNSFYGLDPFKQNLYYFVPIFLVDIIIYTPMVVGYGVVVVLIPFLSNYLATYLQYIQLRLKNVNIDERTTENTEKRIIGELKAICLDHKNAIRFVHAMDGTFSVIFLIKFVISSVFYCLLFFVLVYVRKEIIF